MDNSDPQRNQQRKGKGRQKVDIVKMQNETNLQVTFSKRRNGLFKKASELTSRCGAETAVVVFSPGEKPYSFGHPSVEAVGGRYLAQTDNPPRLVPEEQYFEDNEDVSTELNQLDDQVDVEKGQGKDLHGLLKQPCPSNLWTAVPTVDDLNFWTLDDLKGNLMGFKQNFDHTMQNSAGLGDPYFPQPNPNPSPNPNPNPNLPDQNLQWQQPAGNSSIGFTNYGADQGGMFSHDVQPPHDGSFYGGLGQPMYGYNPGMGVPHFPSPFMPVMGSSGYVVPYHQMARSSSRMEPGSSSRMEQGSSSRMEPGSSSGGSGNVVFPGDPNAGPSNDPTAFQGTHYQRHEP